jgi:DNA-binding MarR family transcriptional regulator
LEEHLKTVDTSDDWRLLFRTFKALDRAREIELERIGVTTIQADVLHALKTANDPVTPAKLSRWLYREPHSISGLINRMEEQGLVRKSKDLGKKNLVRVTLTKEGEQAYEQTLGAKVYPKILSRLSKKEIDNLKVYLDKLHAAAFEAIKALQPLPYS